MTAFIRFGLILCALLVAACQRAGAPVSPSTKGGLTSMRASQVIVEGSSSGGGSFGDESSMTILRWAADDLSAQIRNASPEIFVNLPQGWTQERFAEVIRNVQPTDETIETYEIPEVSRNGQRLMFDYRKNEKGEPYITATRLFTDAYAAYEVNSRPKHEFRATLEEVKMKLAHEAAHLMGLGTTRETDMSEARTFAKRVLEALDADNVECLPAQTLPRQAYPIFEVKDDLMFITVPADADQAAKDEAIKDLYRKRARAYVFNRPSGKGASPSNLQDHCGDLAANGEVSHRQCAPGEAPRYNQDHVSVTKRKGDHEFRFYTIRQAVTTGIREYGSPQGYFSWETVDLRKAVLTDEGFRSDYRYSTDPVTGDYFSWYLDFRVLKADASELTVQTYAPLERETWIFYRSQGEQQISLRMQPDGSVASAKLRILKPFDKWLELDSPATATDIEIPLTCRRSFKRISLPIGKSARVSRTQN